jgi:hypothetical protein
LRRNINLLWRNLKSELLAMAGQRRTHLPLPHMGEALAASRRPVMAGT